MHKVFLKYFFSIFAIAAIIILILFGVLYRQYMVSQDKWMDNVYDDFVQTIEEVMTDGSYVEYGVSSIIRTFKQVEDDRVSGFLIRSTDGSEVLSFGMTPGGRMLTSFSSQQGQREGQPDQSQQNQQEQQDQESVSKKVNNATRLYLTVDYNETTRTSSVRLVGKEKAKNVEVSLPAMIKDEGVIGSIVIAFDNEDTFIIDLLTFNPRTYEYSKDIINSCINGILISIPICVVFALIAAYIISSRNAKYIDEVRKALNDLSHGKSNVQIKTQRNSELNEITVAIEQLDKDLQSNARSRKAWLRSISHDLNTPTTAMKIIIDGLNDGVFPANEEIFSELQKENDSLSERIGRVIDYSTLQSDTEANLEVVDCSQFTDGVLAEIDHPTEVIATSECETMKCDQALMHKAVKELLKNALEFNTDHEVPVRWTIREEGSSYEMVIANLGHLPETLEQDFFEPWARGDWSRTSGGSGLGLSIAATVMALHKGTISLKQVDDQMVQAIVTWPKSN